MDTEERTKRVASMLRGLMSGPLFVEGRPATDEELMRAMSGGMLLAVCELRVDVDYLLESHGT